MVAVSRSSKTSIETWTVSGSTFTPRTGSPSWSTASNGKSRSIEIPDVSIETLARTDATRAMSDWAPRTVASWIDWVGAWTSSPSGTGPGRTSTRTDFDVTCSSLTETYSGVAEITWTRGSAESTTTRTDCACGPADSPARSTRALNIAELIVMFVWSATK